MTFEHFADCMDNVRRYMRRADEEQAALQILFPSSYTMPETSRLLDDYIDIVSFAIFNGAFKVKVLDWLSWYIYETNLGAKPMEVSDGKDSFLVDSDKVFFERVLMAWVLE